MPKRPRMAYPRALSSVVRESLTGLGLAERLREAEIWRIWPDVVGTTLACRAQPVRIINGTLTVAVSSAPWMQELRFMTALMKEKLNERLGADVVRDIVLRAGKVNAPVGDEPLEISPPRHITSEQRTFITEQSEHIADPETRQAFIELMQASLEQQ